MFNVIRPSTIPASLAAKSSYSAKDVVASLDQAFHSKCYICETKDPLILNIEHFRSHQGCESRMYDWNNLFYSCGRCNNFKRHHYDNILDCTDPTLNVLMLVRHIPPNTPFSNIIIEATNDEPSTLQTAHLLNRIFNEADTGNKSITSVQLRKRVYRRYAKVIQHINTFINDDELPSARQLAIEHLKALMDVKQEYSAFLRWPIIESPELFEILNTSINLYEAQPST